MMQRVSPLIRGLLALPRAAQAVSAGPGGGLGLRALSDAAEPQTDTRRLYVGNLSYKVCNCFLSRACRFDFPLCLC